MTIFSEERRQYKRYSAVPIKIYLKRDGEFKSTEMIDISLGGFQVKTDKDFPIYDIYECQIEIPLKDGKDLIYSRAMVWRIEPDVDNIQLRKRYVAFRFTDIQEYDKVVISEFLASFDEDVPYS
jgi:c-di-GMP-binding flagellar brake protein YcgR